MALAGCGEGSAPDAAPPVLRLGYFANVTHAPAIVALEQGYLAEALGPGVKLELRTFNAGPEAVEAIFSDALDISYIGPNPAINAFAQSQGEAIRIVAGATSGGAALVVKPTITSAGAARREPSSRHRSVATRRTSRCGPGSSSRASRRTSRGAATSRSFRSRTRRRSRRFARGRSRAPGFPSRGRRAWCWRGEARCSSTSARCGRTGSS